MKKYIILLISLVTLFVSSCSKSSDPTPTTAAVVDIGTIRYSNNSSKSTYTVYLDGTSLGTLANGYYYDKTNVPTGSHIVKAVQYDGYALYPTTVEKTIIVSKGATIQFDFP